MLALGSVIIVLAGNGDGTAVLNLILPFVRLIGGQHTVHVYGTGGIGKVEAAIGRVELGHRAGELIVVLLVCQLNELLYCLGRGVCVFIRRFVTARFFAAFASEMAVVPEGDLLGSIVERREYDNVTRGVLCKVKTG